MKRVVFFFGKAVEGRKQIVRRTLRYLLERKPSLFKDGIYCLNLEGVQNVKRIQQRIAIEFKLAGSDHNDANFLTQIAYKESVLVFHNCEDLLIN